jgi:glutathione S-transferase
MALPARYQLYYSLRSPFARRVRVAFQRLTLAYEAKEENVFEPSSDFLAANPLGLIPVLVIQSKSEGATERLTLPDSATILEYLHENHGERIWPSDLGIRARVRAASTLAEGLMTEAVRWYLENQRSEPSAAWNQEYLENIDRTLTAIQAIPWKGLPWRVSDFQLTQAGYDLVIALEYMQLRLTGMNWPAKFPDLVRFLDLHRVRQDLAPTAPPP